MKSTSVSGTRFIAVLLLCGLMTASWTFAQQPAESAAVPIKELSPPPPNPADGKHLIKPSPPTPTGGTAADPRIEKEWMFKNLDANSDGKLAKSEFPERMRPGFAKADADADGAASLQEFLRHMGAAAPAPSKGSGVKFRPGTLTFSDLPYASTPNPRQTLDLYLPTNPRSDTPLPAVVFIHGGGWQKGSKEAGTRQIMRFVQTGRYAAVSVGYRLTDEAQWPAQIHDCKAAIRWLKANSAEYFIDPTKIGVWGTSAGGHLASMLGTSGDVKELEGDLGKHLDQNSRVACAVNYFGPANFVTLVRQPSSVDRTQGDRYPEALLLGGAVPERLEVAKQASPVTHVSSGDPPFFTAHGTEDPLVPFAQAEELHSALTRAGVPSILQEITHGKHGFISVDLDQRVAQFFEIHLLGGKGQVLSTPIVFPGGVPKYPAGAPGGR